MTPHINSDELTRLEETLGALEGKHGEGWINISMGERRLFASLLREKIDLAHRAANTPVNGVDQNLAREVHNLRKRLKGYIVNRGKHLDDRGAKDLSRASELLSAKFPTSPALPSQVVGVNLADAATALERSLESEGSGVNAYLRDDIEQAIAAMRSCLTSPAAEPVAWQPIETAPKTPSEVLLWGVMKGRPQPWKYIGSWFPHRDGGWWVAHAMPIHPTHWMPLPAAPALLAALPEREVE